MLRLQARHGGSDRRVRQVTPDQILVSANQAIRDRMADILDWTPACGIEELEQKASGVCEEMVLLVDRVRREMPYEGEPAAAEMVER